MATITTERCPHCHQVMLGQPAIYHDNYLRIDYEAVEVRARGQKVHLRPTEWKLLTFLVRERGQTVSHDTILSHLYGSPMYICGDLGKWHLAQLRHALAAAAGREAPIVTVRGFGYRYEAP